MLKKRTGKYHWYPNKSKPGRKRSYPKTACGRDGNDVGGFITFFFRECVNDSSSCKICVKKFKENPDA